jgi:MYXO-CTERM domain-containing protein
MRLVSSILISAVSAVGALVAFQGVAHAGLESCGNIQVSADAQCKVETMGGCTAQCTPISFQGACSASLETSCNGTCNVMVDVSCQDSCVTDCSGTCTANPGSLDCSANCKGTCEADCTGKCSASANQAECEGSCKSCCGGHCDAQCTGTPPSATCDAKCSASCQGSCSGKANLDCQISCQSKGYASCEGNLMGGCTAQCTQPSGALFCDGQYVDTGNNLQNCIDALNAILKIKVTASGEASCDGGVCQASGMASASCAASPGEAPLSGGFLFAGLGLAAIAARRSKRQHQR